MDRRLLPLAVGTFAIGTDGFVIAGILPSIARSLDVPLATAGQLVTVFAITYAVFAPVAGAVSANLDRRLALIVALGFFLAGGLLTAVAPTYGVLLTGRVIGALGSAMFTPIATGVAAAVSAPERRGKALAVVTGGMTVASALGVPAGALVNDVLDWRAVRWLVVVLGVAALLGVLLALPSLRLPGAGLRERLGPLRDPRALGILLVTLLYMAAGWTLFTYIGESVGVGETAMTAVMWVWGVGSVAGNVLAGRVTDRRGPVPVLMVGLGVMVVVLGVLPLLTGNLPLVIAWALVYGFFGWFAVVPQQVRLTLLAPEAATVLLGLNSSALYLGVAAGGAIGGIGLGWVHASGLGYLAAGIGLLTLVIAALGAQGRRSTRSEPSASDSQPEATSMTAKAPGGNPS
ncbi:MFS transporter [Bailinhaonella thermotolerans]|uniref:MFS transporter n=1 Tax=Bailinhaonella thermotolerans TaxID=1070861 RepID=A0A3A4A1S2_9ACTN|nr:MFS transporter [Bailinhaonella thermotolerans]RJL20396.1 MFS transporter [Bailinhaonella thermotolerans]